MNSIATSGDPVIQMHRGVATGARAAAAGLPTVSAAGMRPGHAAILETALSETRKTLTELALVADVGAGCASALSEQDAENGRSYEQVPEVRRV